MGRVRGTLIVLAELQKATERTRRLPRGNRPTLSQIRRPDERAIILVAVGLARGIAAAAICRGPYICLAVQHTVNREQLTHLAAEIGLIFRVFGRLTPDVPAGVARGVTRGRCATDQGESQARSGGARAAFRATEATSITPGSIQIAVCRPCARPEVAAGGLSQALHC